MSNFGGSLANPEFNRILIEVSGGQDQEENAPEGEKKETQNWKELL